MIFLLTFNLQTNKQLKTTQHQMQRYLKNTTLKNSSAILRL
jgi:hypothetical protein